MQDDKILEVKKTIVKLVCSRLEKNLDIAKSQFERTKQDVIEAPGRMQSRYDSSKQELGYLADSLQKRIGEIHSKIAILKNQKISTAPQGKITMSALVETEKNLYFILPVGGGEKIISEHSKKEITVVTPSSPFGRILMDKTVGDSILIRSEEITIISVL